MAYPVYTTFAVYVPLASTVGRIAHQIAPTVGCRPPTVMRVWAAANQSQMQVS
jgi:hypothetical protein